MENYKIAVNHQAFDTVCETLIESSRTIDQMTNVELLTSFLEDDSNQGKEALAKNILCNGPLKSFQSISLQELLTLGVNEQKAAGLVAIMELAKRSFRAFDEEHHVLSSSDLAQRLMLEMGDEPQEKLVALYLNTQNRVIEQRTIFVGSVRRSLAEPREILHYAVKNMATSVIIVHNHPSGKAKPSRNDDEVTRKFIASCKVLDIVPLDHIIVGKDEYYSYREETDFFKK